MHEARIAEMMAPFQNDAIGFASTLQLQLQPAAQQVLQRIQDTAEGGAVGLESNEVHERAALLGLFWWLLRKPDSLVVVGCNSTPQVVACLALIHAVAHRVGARIAEHITFPAHNRMKVARRAGWGMVFEVCPDARLGHDAPNLAALEIGANKLGNGLILPVRSNVLRVSTWESREHGA